MPIYIRLFVFHHSPTISELRIWQRYLYFSVFVRSTADGNCLYNSCALLLTGHEDLCHVLRAATSLELCLNNDFYATHPFIETKIVENPGYHKNSIFGMAVSNKAGKKWSSGEESINKCILREAMYNTSNRNWGSLLCMLALSSVVGHQIKSVYPSTDNLYEKVFNGVIYPHDTNDNNGELHIMWSRFGSIEKELTTFQPNHFIPVLLKKPILSIDCVTTENLERPAKMMKLDGKGIGMCF